MREAIKLKLKSSRFRVKAFRLHSAEAFIGPRSTMRFWGNLRLRRDYAADQKRASFTRLRCLLFVVNFMKWASACIVMAIASYFIHDFPRDGSTTFQEIIACTSIGFFLPTMPLAFYRHVTFQLIPIDYIYSHLWVTAFIFAALDYNKHECSTHSPARLHSCRLKYALESWCIIAV